MSSTSPTSPSQPNQPNPGSGPTDPTQIEHDLAFVAVAEGRQLLVHCSVVCPKSAPIAQIVAAAPPGTNKVTIEITDFNRTTVQAMLDYIYHCDFSTPPYPNTGIDYEHWIYLIVDIIGIAHRYEIVGLKELSFRKLSTANQHFMATRVQLDDALSIRLIRNVYERTTKAGFPSSIRQMFSAMALSRLDAFLQHGDFWRALRETDGFALDLLFRTHSCWKEERREADRLRLEGTASRAQVLQLGAELSGVQAELARVRNELGEERRRQRANSSAAVTPQGRTMRQQRVAHSPHHCRCALDAKPEHLEPSDDVNRLPTCLICGHSVFFFTNQPAHDSSYGSEGVAPIETDISSPEPNQANRDMGTNEYPDGFGDSEVLGDMA